MYSLYILLFINIGLILDSSVNIFENDISSNHFVKLTKLILSHNLIKQLILNSEWNSRSALKIYNLFGKDVQKYMSKPS